MLRHAWLTSWLVAAVLAWSTAAQAMTEAHKFVGAWRLVSAEYRSLDGEPLESPWGDAPQGRLMYDSYGSMAVQLGRSERARFASGDQLRGTDDEVRRAFESYSAYYGRYEVDERTHTVTHRVEHALFPNWSGSQQVRSYRFADGRLILSTPPIRRGGREVVGVLVWERVK